MRRGAEKAQKSAPWVAIALAIIGPLFGYLEVRAVHRSVGRQAGEAKAGTGAAYRLLVREIERHAEDIDACHERVDRLAEALEETTVAPPPGVAEQRAIERPVDSGELPTEADELPEDSPLHDALEEADESDW